MSWKCRRKRNYINNTAPSGAHSDMKIGTAIRLKLLHELSKRMSLANIAYLLNLKRIRDPFRFNGERLDYLFHSYNNMGLTERTVEIPIIKHYLRRKPWSRVLEIGNVTNYYEDYFCGMFPNKIVVDKIERAYNVTTSDIAKFRNTERFDLIFSISTFEHMDSDLGRNPDHVPGTARHGTVAADNIIHCYENLLAEGGLMVITAPLGYTPEWDQTFKGRLLDDYSFKCLRKLLASRVGEQEWVQAGTLDACQEYAYDRPFPYGNHVAVLEICK